MNVGFVQNDPQFGKVAHNLARLDALLDNQRADLLVLPELFNTGYQFTTREEALALAEPLTGGPTLDWLMKTARCTGATLVAGLAEKEGSRVYNSAVLAGADGILGHYRKAHLFDTEKSVFDPGDLPLAVFDIGAARVGIMICFDWRFPETARTLALKGADIIAHPSNLVLKHCPDAMITRCLENRVFAITADRVGAEERLAGPPLRFIGQSQIVDPDGDVLFRASPDREEVKVLSLDIRRAREKRINPNNDLFADRREDLYIPR
ncbi:MAG: acyltransferase [Nitrospinaceae bacterium]|jgi:predicted amidohydrolase|nr:MAG: acyltransferase [Nitrospinaceae bacterium]